MCENESFCTFSCGAQSEWSRKPCRSRTTVYALQKRMDDGEGINRRAGSGRKTVVKCNSLRNVIRGTTSDVIRGTTSNGRKSCHNPQQSFDHCLHVCWYLRHRPCASWSGRRLCKTPQEGLRPRSLCVPHEEVQKLSLDCLSVEPFWSTQQQQIFFLRCHSYRASGGLNKPR